MDILKKLSELSTNGSLPIVLNAKVGHSHDLCLKRVRDEVPKAPSMAVKPRTMEDNEEGFVEVKRRKKNKGDESRSFGGI
ncbi:hypothetical protein Tco_1207231, partial [Tanacetum coccineum]